MKSLLSQNSLGIDLKSTWLMWAMVFILPACTKQQSEEKGNNELPDPTRFTYETIADGMDEPMQLDFDSQGNVYFIERTGALKMVGEEGGNVKRLGNVPLAVEKAPGLIGILMNKEFINNRQLFLYYSAREDKGAFMRLSRFTLDEKGIMAPGSEVVLLKIPWEQPDGEHFGGGMCWDLDGNLLLSVGGDSAPTQYAPLPFTNQGGRGQDSGRTAGNTNDLRGSIIRIKPQSEGTYTIPPGNLFPDNLPNTRPEIYVMGNRNPWRLSVDSKTGFLHWGEVGPDAGVDSEELGPMGYDEFNVAKEAGNFGWPFFIGKNLAYNSYIYELAEYSSPYNPASPVNTSPNNTGLMELPPAQPALVAYPYRVSEEWPLLESAARSAVGGPIFRKTDFDEGTEGLFPEFFEGKWLVTDYVRNWIMVMDMNEDRTEVNSIVSLLPSELLKHKQPLDLDFGPDGAVYVVEYGLTGQGRISKIKYNAGNRTPIAKAASNITDGAVPMEVNLNSEGSMDHDGDALRYLWTIQPEIEGTPQTFDIADPKLTLGQPGKYKVTLKVSDTQGEFDETAFKIIAGNHRPEVQIEITKGNSTFFFPNDTIQYEVRVNDAEDGATTNGNIPVEEVFFSAEYIPSGMRPEELTLMENEGLIKPGTAIRHVQAQSLLQQLNCMTCHQVENKLVGPSYLEVAQRYASRKNAADTLYASIMEGVSGKWGESIMPPHPMLASEETFQIIDYILNLAKNEAGYQELPLKGEFSLEAYDKTGPVSRLGKFFNFEVQPGSYIFRASYTDKGIPGNADIQLSGREIILLRYPILAPQTADFISEEGISFTPSTDDPGFMFTGKGGHLGFKDIDLTGLSTINIGAVTRFWYWSHYIGGTLELRLDSLDGKLVGAPFEIIPPLNKEGDGPFFGEAAGKPVPIDVSMIDGVHDIYIIIRNEKARERDALVIMTGIEFIKE
ncbi:MAG: PQQ-dependent sugar dehydrogenase [Cyclobacteriaceae bacterium]